MLNFHCFIVVAADKDFFSEHIASSAMNQAVMMKEIN